MTSFMYDPIPDSCLNDSSPVTGAQLGGDGAHEDPGRVFRHIFDCHRSVRMSQQIFVGDVFKVFLPSDFDVGAYLCDARQVDARTFVDK